MSLAVAMLALIMAGEALFAEDLSSIAGWKGAAPNSAERFTFVVMSDRTGGHVPGRWEQAVHEVNLLRPDFVICVGDLIEGYTPDDEKRNAEWSEFEGFTTELAAPFFYCPGNHDIAAPTGQSAESARAVYLARHGVAGRSYYSFNYQRCHFVVLDSSGFEIPELLEEQLAWLASDVAGATTAEHLFVFYHHPVWMQPELWARLKANFPVGKTTIFNGHWHGLSYHEEAGTTTYVLPSTASYANEAALLGSEQPSFARISVDHGEPTFALVPLGALRASGAAKLTAQVFEKHGNTEAAMRKGEQVAAFENGVYTFRQENPDALPMTVRLVWSDPATVRPAEQTVVVPGGQTGVVSFTLKPNAPEGTHPVLTATMEVASPLLPAPLMFQRKVQLLVPYQRVLHRIAAVKLDAVLDDWAGVVPLEIGTSDQVVANPQSWSGPSDGSCAFRVATDGQRLLVSAEVRDNQIQIGASQPYQYDCLEFFWDARPEAGNPGTHGPGSGQLILLAPTDTQPAQPFWYMGDRPAPQNVEIASRRTLEGYICEWAIPLNQLGLPKGAVPGESIRMELILNDLDVDENGQTAQAKLVGSGVGECHVQTQTYTRYRLTSVTEKP